MCPVSQAGCYAKELLNTDCDPAIQSAQARTGDIHIPQGLTWVGAHDL